MVCSCTSNREIVLISSARVSRIVVSRAPLLRRQLSDANYTSMMAQASRKYICRHFDDQNYMTTTSNVERLRSIPHNGPLARYVILGVAHAPGMPATFTPSPRASDPDMHHGTCVTHVPRCMPVSFTSGFL